MSYVSVISAVAFLLLLLTAFTLARHRAGGGLRGLLCPSPPTSRRLRLLETLAVDPKRRILRLDCAGDELIVLVGGPNDLLLAKRDAAFASALAEHLS